MITIASLFVMIGLLNLAARIQSNATIVGLGLVGTLILAFFSHQNGSPYSLGILCGSIVLAVMPAMMAMAKIPGIFLPMIIAGMLAILAIADGPIVVFVLNS